MTFDNSPRAWDKRTFEALRRELEHIRMTRRRNWRATQDNTGKNNPFHRDHFGKHFHLPWYERFRKGERKEPLAFSDILAFADACCCTEIELLQILAAGNFRQTLPPLTGDAFEHAVAVTQRTMDYLARDFPATLMTYRWDIVAWNEHISPWLGADAATLRDLHRAGHLNILWMFFDREGPLRVRLGGISPDHWRDFAKDNIAGFKRENLFAQHEEWYQTLVEDLSSRSNEFHTLWKDVPLSERAGEQRATYVTTFASTTNEPMQFITTDVESVVGAGVSIAIYHPANAATVAAYRALGIPTPDLPGNR
jgi:hypothetical protein